MPQQHPFTRAVSCTLLVGDLGMLVTKAEVEELYTERSIGKDVGRQWRQWWGCGEIGRENRQGQEGDGEAASFEEV
ncbi:hypothetical protein D9758_018004 [Tetrapyrgos nigripes]|uniref:Uncharacterized protein n=1 Tax=Tetrapyrgos nigripes TaxID=182062 RepID=A0A8H5F9D0_9AGAR|nr:hypothetical protein D9758_018004 [Tetrapyrgos nigripes]